MLRIYTTTLIIVLSTFTATAQEQIWDGLDAQNAPFWNDGKKMYALNSGNLVFRSNQEGSTYFMNSIYIDYSKDFEISMEITSNASYYFLINTSADGINGQKLQVYNHEFKWERWLDDNPKTLFKKKNKGIDTRKPHSLEIKYISGVLEVEISQLGNKTVLYQGEFKNVIPDLYNCGFRLYESSEDLNKQLTVTKMEVKYTPIDLIQQNQSNFEMFGEKENLGLVVNSSNDEVSPVISQDGTALYFTRCEDNIDKELIYESKIVEGRFTTPEKMGNNFTNYNSLINMSPDNKTAYLKGDFSNGRLIGSGISISNFNSNMWKEAKGLDLKKFKTSNEMISSFVSSDGRIIISSLDKNGGVGETDLYVTLLDEKGAYSDLINLGNVLNSKEKDISPFLCSDNQTLFFASFRQGGLGESDIYMSKRLDDSWTNWSEPINLGPKINSTNWDAYMSVPASGDYAYFVSYDKSLGGGADIFRVRIKDENAKPEPVILLSGTVLDSKTNDPIESKIVYKDLITGKVIGEASSDSKNGFFQLVLPYKSKYAIFAEADDFYAKRDTIDITKLTKFKKLEKNLYLQKMEVGTPIRLNNIFFETGKSVLLPESFDELNRLLNVLNENEAIKIRIEGHTDNEGSDESNQKLSEDRAKSVFNYLIQNNIDIARIQSVGFGETKPLKDNTTIEGRQYNRRVEFVIIGN